MKQNCGHNFVKWQKTRVKKKEDLKSRATNTNEKCLLLESVKSSLERKQKHTRAKERILPRQEYGSRVSRGWRILVN